VGAKLPAIAAEFGTLGDGGICRRDGGSEFFEEAAPILLPCFLLFPFATFPAVGGL
jgi:hypothetical protein